MTRLKDQQMRGKELAHYAASLPPDTTFRVSVEVVEDDCTLTPEQISGVEEARRSPDFATDAEVEASMGKVVNREELEAWQLAKMKAAVEYADRPDAKFYSIEESRKRLAARRNK